MPALGAPGSGGIFPAMEPCRIQRVRGAFTALPDASPGCASILPFPGMLPLGNGILQDATAWVLSPKGCARPAGDGDVTLGQGSGGSGAPGGACGALLRCLSGFGRFVWGRAGLGRLQACSRSCEQQMASLG